MSFWKAFIKFGLVKIYFSLSKHFHWTLWNAYFTFDILCCSFGNIFRIIFLIFFFLLHFEAWSVGWFASAADTVIVV